MFRAECLDRLRRRLGPDAPADTLLLDLLEDAEEAVLAYTRREILPACARGAVLELAVRLFNRRGTEGESARTEGSLRCSFELLDPWLRARLAPLRRARTIHAQDDLSGEGEGGCG